VSLDGDSIVKEGFHPRVDKTCPFAYLPHALKRNADCRHNVIDGWGDGFERPNGQKSSVFR
jgi:hypothetical protein